MNAINHSRTRPGGSSWTLLALALLLVLAVPKAVLGQFTYTFSAVSGTYTQVSAGGFDLNSIEVDDAHSAAIGLPFDFGYNGVAVGSIRVSSNGWISMDDTDGPGAAVGRDNSTFGAANGAVRPGVFALWDDLDGTGGTARYETTGSAPNRVFTMEWRNWQWDFSGGNNISFECKLYETTNVIEFIYRQEAGAVNNGSGGASIGLLASASGTYYSLNNTGASPTASTSVATVNLSTKPATGQIYRFTPTGCTAPNISSTTNSGPICTGTALNLTTTATGTAPLKYAWTGTGTFSDNTISNPSVTGAATGTYSVTVWNWCGASTSGNTSATVVPAPTASNAGPDQTICSNATATLAANTPGVGTGAWSILAGSPNTSTAQLSSTTAAAAVFTPTTSGTYTLRWTISNSPCTASTNDVVITVNAQPAAPTMTPTSASICSGGPVVLSASTPNTTGTFTGGAITIQFTGSTPYPSALNVTGLPTTGVTVSSVRLNGMLHDNPEDMDILLRSPTGTNVVLMSDAGGTANLTSNNYTFQDGSPAMTTGFNASGTYGPTNLGATDNYTTLGSITQGTPALSSFSGNPNGSWGLYTMDDNLNLINGSLTSWSITFNVPMTYAWSPATGLSPTTGASVTCTATSNQTYTVTVTNPITGCQNTNTVAVSVSAQPTSANAGPAQSICATPGSATMAANTPLAGTGAWSQVSGPVTATITTPASPTSTITGMTTAGAYVFRWTISNAPCTASQGNVTITVTAPPTTAAAGPDQSICTSVGTATMAANTPSVGTAAWSQLSGPVAASIVSGSSPSTAINGLTTAGTYVFRWTISNGGCTPSTSDVNITVNGVPTTANAGPPQTVCANPGSATMAANNPGAGAGAWTQLSGPVTATITTPSAFNTTIAGMTTAGSYVFRWTISNSPCISSQSSVTITVNPEPTAANAGSDQSVCVSPGTTTMAANTALVGNGAWSQISGPLAASIADASDPLTGVSGLSAAGTYVFRWSISSASCTTSEDDVDVVVSASPTTANAGADQNICSTLGNATMAGNTPAVGTGAWTQIAGPVSATITTAASPTTSITGMTTAGTYTFRWTISNNPCSVSTDDVDIISGGCNYYSQASGDIADPIWALVPVGTPGFATFNSTISMTVQNGHTVTNTSTTAVEDVTVNAGGTLVLNSGTTFQVNGTAPTFTGALTASDNSELELASAAATTLTLANTTSFFVLTVNTPAGTTLSGTAHIRGTLLLQDGNFNCTGFPVVLRSTATYTGRLGPVAATASYTGNMRIERYIPAGATNWRLLGSPIVNRKVNHWQDDFTTAGYPGSHVPFFDNPVGSGILWPSIRWYDETNTGAGQNDGMTGVASNNHALTSGMGFAAWCGTSLQTTTAFNVDLENQAPVIANSPISLPMTYTNTGNPTIDGWNLVSNPLPSPIAFDQIVRGADVADYITYFNPATGNTAAYDISSGISQNGGTNVIQSMQGFFLRATGAAATATVDESAKVADNSGGFFGGLEDGPTYLRLQIASGINSFSDETVIVFSEGSPAVDGNDVPKYIFAHPAAPQIASMADNGQLFAINAYGPYANSISIPVMVDAAVSGTYTITATGLEDAGLSCLRIEDLLTGTTTVLTEGATYDFEMDATADATAPRLMIHASAPINVAAMSAACHGDANGSAELVLTESNATVIWMNDMGATIAEQADASGTVTVNDLAAGDYQVSVNGYLGCAVMMSTFVIEQPEVLAATGDVTDASCPNTADGQVNIVVNGGTAPYSFAWSNGGTDAELIAGAGTYLVDITDANNCAIAGQIYVIGAGVGPVAAADAQQTTVTVGIPVLFINNSVAGDSYLWEFGDGATSEEIAPSHAYDLPGSYTVMLTATNGACTSSTTVTITVELSTGIADRTDLNIGAWMNGDNLVVEHGFADQYPLQLDVLNEAGQIYAQHRVAGPAGRMTIPAGDLASGIWYIRLSNNEVRRTIPVVIVR